MSEIKIFESGLFSSKGIKAGITQKMQDLYPENGFSVYPTEAIDSVTSKQHLLILSDYLKIDTDKLICARQIHSDIIVDVNSDYVFCEADALILTDKKIVVYVKIADCAGVLVYDAKQNIAAAIHSGWRGSLLNISGKTIEKLKKVFKSNPSDLLVYISPCASVKNYEVGSDLAELFSYQNIEKIDGKLYFDNKRTILNQLLKTGIPAANIEISDICSIESNNCHSYRRDKNNSGRMAAFIGLK